jgi:predicted ester cyclase
LSSPPTFAEGMTMDVLDSLRPVPADSHPLSRRGALARVGAGAAALALAARAIPSAAQETSSETNEGIVRKLYAAYNAGAWEALAEVIAVDAVDHDAVPGQAPGLAGITQQLMVFKAAFSGEVMVDELVSETVWVTDRVHLDGTHTGDFFGIPATGKSVHIEAIEMWKTKDGKIVEGWHVENLLQALIQLGAIPAPDGAPAASPEVTPAG